MMSLNYKRENQFTVPIYDAVCTGGYNQEDQDKF